MNDNQLDTSETDIVEKRDIWFWNESLNALESDIEDERYSDIEESDLIILFKFNIDFHRTLRPLFSNRKRKIFWAPRGYILGTTSPKRTRS